MSSPAFDLAKERYAEIGVDVERALQTLAANPISLHCWQADDVAGFEEQEKGLAGGGIQATGSYPGKARTIDELRGDLEKALTLIPGNHRLNLHASYGDFGGAKVDRNEVSPEHFQSWFDWCKANNLGLDFNPTCFKHPLADDGFTLSSANEATRQFWIEHCIACRKIGAEAGRQLGSACVTNIWIPDGAKDLVVDRKGPRERLEASLDAVLAEKIDPSLNLDAVESKLFGIGSESYVVGSHEFYLGYAVSRQTVLCIDAGHFHPTESVADKISSVLEYVPEIILHVSRGVRWDSDHVVLLDDPTKAIFEELVRGDFLPRTHIGLDFFDASINRVAAYAIGTRNALKSLLIALLEPLQTLRHLELEGDFTARLALLEESKTLPFGAVWEEYCERNDVAPDRRWLDEVRSHESEVLAART